MDQVTERSGIVSRAIPLARTLSPYLQVVGAALLLALLAQFRVHLPFTPVPVTLQTFTVFLIGLMLGPKKAPAAVLLYLVGASAGLPILAGGNINPLWLTGAGAGYLIGFVVAATVMGYLSSCSPPKNSFFRCCLIAALGELIILGCGFASMTRLFGTQQALLAGVVPFLLPALYKIVAAASIASGTSRLLRR